MTIKAGDLVMVVRLSPCCGSSQAIGKTFVVLEVKRQWSTCLHCGYSSETTHALVGDGDKAVLLARLKKIDPPADGDSLPTRKDLEVPA